MGIRFYCPNGHKLHVKAFQAGMRGICPYCGAKVQIPLHSTRPSTKELKARRAAGGPEHAAIPRGDTAMPESRQPGVDSSPEKAPDGQGVLPGEQEQPTPFIDLDKVLAARNLGDQGGLRSSPSPLEGDLAISTAESVRSRNSVTEEWGSPGESARSFEKDPLAEPNVVWYVRPPSGGQYGPAAPEVVRTWIAENRITPDTYVWREGWRDWQLARDVFPEVLAKALPEVPVEDQPERRLIRRSVRSSWAQYAIVAFAAIVICVLGGLVWLFVSRSSP